MKMVINQVMHKIERVLKTDIRYLLKGGVWLVIGQIISGVAAFCTSIAFAYFVSPTVYGLYKYIQSIVSIITSFTITGFSTSLIRSAAINKDGALSFSVRKSLEWSFPSITIGLVVAMYYIVKDNYLFGFAILIATILFTISNAWILYGAFLSGKKEFAINTKYHLISSIITPSILIGTMIVSPGIIQLTIAYFLPPLILNKIYLDLTTRKFVKNTETEPEFLKDSIDFSFVNVIASVAQNIDKIVIFQFMGPIDLAVYNFAKAVPDQVGGLLKSVSRLAFPKFAEQNWRQVRSNIGQKTIVFVAFSTVTTFVYIATAPFIYRIFFPTYSSSIVFSQLIALGLIAAAGSLPYTALQAHKKTKSTYIYIIVTSIVQIITTTIGIIYFSLHGAVVALVFNKFLSSFISYWLVKSDTSESDQRYP